MAFTSNVLNKDLKKKLKKNKNENNNKKNKFNNKMSFQIIKCLILIIKCFYNHLDNKI